MPGEVASSKLIYDVLAVHRAFPTIINIKAPFHHVTLEQLSACTTTVHAENHSSHIIKLMCNMRNLVGNLKLQGKPNWHQALSGCNARCREPLLRC